MNYAFQDRENLYLAMDLMSGGDLRYHINRIKIFSEEQSSINKFFTIFYIYNQSFSLFVC